MTAERDVLEHALGRAGVLDKGVQLLGILLYDNHGVVIDFGGIVSHEPVLIGKIDLNWIGGLAGLEALT